MIFKWPAGSQASRSIRQMTCWSRGPKIDSNVLESRTEMVFCVISLQGGRIAVHSRESGHCAGNAHPPSSQPRYLAVVTRGDGGDRAAMFKERAGLGMAKLAGSTRGKPGLRILRSAQLLRSATVKSPRNGLALTIFSRVIRPVASALAMRDAASAFSGTDRIATAPAAPAKCARYSVPGVTGRPVC